MDKAQQILERIRTSEELGKDSCSTYDECYSDEELLEEIEEELWMEDRNVEEMFQYFLSWEELRLENEREVAVGYGGF